MPFIIDPLTGQPVFKASDGQSYNLDQLGSAMGFDPSRFRQSYERISPDAMETLGTAKTQMASSPNYDYAGNIARGVVARQQAAQMGKQDAINQANQTNQQENINDPGFFDRLAGSLGLNQNVNQMVKTALDTTLPDSSAQEKFMNEALAASEQKNRSEALGESQPGIPENRVRMQPTQSEQQPVQNFNQGFGIEDLGEKYLPEYQKAMGQQQAGQVSQIKAGQEAARDRGEIAKGAENYYQTEMDRMEGISKWYDQQQLDSIDRYKEFEEEILKSDPLSREEAKAKVWDQKSTPGKILAGVGYVLANVFGGTAAGQAGIRSMENAIQTEIINQERKNEDMKFLQNNRLNLMGQMSGIFSDRKQARVASNMIYNRIVDSKLAQIENRLTDEQAKGQIQEIRGQWNEKYLSFAYQLDQLQQNNKIELIKEAQKKGPTIYDLQQYMEQGGELHPSMIEDKDQAKRFTRYGFTNSETSAKDLSEADKNFRTVRDNIQELIEISNTPIQYLRRGQIARAKMIVAELKAKSRIEVTGGGNISTYEQKILDALAPNPTKLWSFDYATRIGLEKLQERYQRGLEYQLKTNNMYNDFSQSKLGEIISLKGQGYESQGKTAK